ncbi:MAG: 5'-3' exonuclease H3TH domain-containing protein, partial [Patescibacteria group bacterium]
PTKGLSEGKLYGEAEVVEKMGVPPKQIPDLKALMGDASDNYPGVAGIGLKTATKLLSEYATVEKLIKAKKVGDDARLGLVLATIHTDVPVEIKPLEPLETLDTPEARRKLEEFHFPSLIKRLSGEKAEKQVKRENGQLTLV